MDQREYWDRVSYEKEFTTPFQMELFERYVPRSGNILDVGCGYGRTLNELSQAGYAHLTGVDFSQGMIQRGRTQFPQLDLRVRQGCALGLSDGCMDAVILFAVLTCIPGDDEQRALITEIRRVLKPGGVLYVNDFLLNTDARNIQRYQAFQEKYGVYGVFELPGRCACRHHDVGWIRTLLADFTPLAFDRLTFATMNGHTSNGFYFLGRAQ